MSTTRTTAKLVMIEAHSQHHIRHYCIIDVKTASATFAQETQRQKE
jgi:hypothetical protein